MEMVLITARPSATNVQPYNLFISEFTLAAPVAVIGKSFIKIRNLYLSASNISIFNGLSYTFYDPFSGIPNLAPKNQGFVAYAVPKFNLLNDHGIIFNIPIEIIEYVASNAGFEGHLDVIVENEAGYGLLSRDSYSWRISSWSSFENLQKPCINGIFVANVIG